MKEFHMQLVDSIQECRNVKCWLYRKQNPHDPFMTGFKFNQNDDEAKIMKQGFLYTIEDDDYNRIGLIQCFEAGTPDIHVHFYVDTEDLNFTKEVAENSLSTLLSYFKGIRVGCVKEGDAVLPLAKRSSRPRYMGMRFLLNRKEMEGIADVLEKLGARIVETSNTDEPMYTYRIAIA